MSRVTMVILSFAIVAFDITVLIVYSGIITSWIYYLLLASTVFLIIVTIYNLILWHQEEEQ